jgi:hypothetical protein
MTFSWCGYGYAETEVTPDITLSCHILAQAFIRSRIGPYHGRLASLWICGASMALGAPKR